jgi:uncharacterized protein
MGDLLTHWPFWVGSIAFGLLVVGYWKLMGFPIGASGSYARVTDAAVDPEEARRQQAMADPDALEAALRAATEAQFGNDQAMTGQLPWTAHLVFLGMMGLGGLLAALLRGNYQFTFDLGPEHTKYFGTGVTEALVLLSAGIMVGFGTRMAGGCSSGHGLSGCSRLQPGSLIATGAFFGAAVAISFLLSKVFA